MIKINVGYRPMPVQDNQYMTCSPMMVTTTLYGESAEEIKQKMNELADSSWGRDIWCTGLMNKKDDWIAAFGDDNLDGCSFADTKYDKQGKIINEALSLPARRSAFDRLRHWWHRTGTQAGAEGDNDQQID